MNWTKIPTNLLISRTPDNELVAIVKYQLLWADLEYQPTDEIALRYMSNKQLASVKQYLNDIETQVVSDIKSTVNHRGGQKTYYKKKQSLKQNNDGHCDNHCDNHCDSQYDVADKMREDKRREEKENSLKESAHPSLSQVLEYAAQQNEMAGCGGYKISQEEAESFFATFAASGWKIHNAYGTPIRDWKAYLRQWAIKKERERLDKLEKDGIPLGPRPFRDDSENHE